MAKDAALDVENLTQVKLQLESVKEALASMDETIQLQETQLLRLLSLAQENISEETTSSQTSFLHEEAAQRKSKLEQLNQRLNQTKVELTDLANGLHDDLARRVADLSTLLDAKTTNIRTNSSAIRTLEAG
eukprot:g1516.t1